MGLDQYLFAEDTPNQEDKELYYFRKHANLEGFMAALFYARGNTNEFNCERLYLSEDDINTLETAVKLDGLPETTGFFFGQSTEQQMVNTWDFIHVARKALDSNKKIYYTSWW